MLSVTVAHVNDKLETPCHSHAETPAETPLQPSMCTEQHSVILTRSPGLHRCVSTEKQHAEAVHASLSGQYPSTSDSPVVSTLGPQPSSSSSCLNGGGPSQQSGRTMESSATASHDPHRPHHTEQPQRLSTEALSPFSQGKAQNSMGADHPRHNEPLLHRSDALTRPVSAPSHIEHHSMGNRRSATPSEAPALSPTANGNVGTNGPHHLQQALPQAEAVASEAAPSTHPCRAGTPPQPPQPASMDKPLASMSTVSTSAQSAANPTQASSLPSGAYMIPYPAASLPASPQASPLHVHPMQAASRHQPATSQPTAQHQPLPQQLPPQSQQLPPQSQQQHQQQQQHEQHQQLLHQQQQQQHQQQQQLLQQQRYHMFLQAQALQQQQAAQKQASFQSQQQQQQGQMGKPPLQQPLGLQGPQQGQQGRQATLLAVQPRKAHPVWPVPLPRPTSGMSTCPLCCTCCHVSQCQPRPVAILSAFLCCPLAHCLMLSSRCRNPITGTQKYHV